MKNILRMDTYDEFSCIADRCPFTCCRGWDIKVDTDTCNRWKSDEQQILDLPQNIKIKKKPKESQYSIKMASGGCCPFLDGKGLCKVVIHYGDDYLPETCRKFPRQEYSRKGLSEYSISCTCPAAVDLMNKANESMKFIYSGDPDILENLPAEYRIRDTMIKIMQNNSFSLTDRILLVFYMLLGLRKEHAVTDEALNIYQDSKYLSSLADVWNGIEPAMEGSFQETNELFLDIVSNYKNEKSYSRYLKNISTMAEDLNQKEWDSFWRNSREAFRQYDCLMENCIVTKIFSDCISDDIDDMIVKFQMIITEYVMVRYSTFLSDLWRQRKDSGSLRTDTGRLSQTSCFVPDYVTVRDYIVVYSRIIEYNTEGIKEFWEDSFDEAVWEFGYMLVLVH